MKMKMVTPLCCLALSVVLLPDLAFAKKSAGEITKIVAVDCDSGNTNQNSIQDAVDSAVAGTKIEISGNCNGDVTITTDDITLSGGGELACNKGDPMASSQATLNGTIFIRGARATIQQMHITGSGSGVEIRQRSMGNIVCNSISMNQGTGVLVSETSHVEMIDNTVDQNGLRGELYNSSPYVFFDCGIILGSASSASSTGNTYSNNYWCEISANHSSHFRNGEFTAKDGSTDTDPNLADTVISRSNTDAYAVDAFMSGIVDFKNSTVTGPVSLGAGSTLRVDDDVIMNGDIFAGAGSMVRIKNRGTVLNVDYTGTLNCDANSFTFYSDVACGQTCTNNNCSP